jgi:hypothetical protein
MYNYFIIFKPKNEDEYRMYTNQIFTTDKDGEEFALKSLGKKIKYKVVEYNSKNIKDYWN